ncbi:MAG: D-alanine--D-alanine ligase [Melioribacteraceae bacterium]|nr:D-alanine--D-alanine ligase [Melioribacteraceae bacterium]
MLNKKLRVALTYNIKPEDFSSAHQQLSHSDSKTNDANDIYAEWDSAETINALKNALAKYHDVLLIEADENAFIKLKELRPEIVFNVAEGAYGISREAQIPAMLDMLQIPYTGSDPLTLTTCLDKARTKEILAYHNIPTSKFILVNSLSEVDNVSISFPLMVKPVGEGSSKGIFNSSLVYNTGELKKLASEMFSRYNQPIIIEEFLPGREFTVALLGNGDSVEVLPIVEINLDQLPSSLQPIYSYEAKWIADTRENPLNIFTCPAKIDKALEKQIKETAINTFKIMRCRDWCRIDMRLDANGIPNIIELNPLPGILPDPKDNSCFPKAARTAGYSYDEMINKVLLTAAQRNSLI